MRRPSRQVLLVPPTRKDGEDSLVGLVERITYRAEDTGYAVLRIQVPGTPEPITAVGNLGAAQVGEEVSLHGRWTRNPKYGPQLEVTSYRATVPSTVAGLRRYLGSGLIHGIGKELARRIVERFGERTLEVLDVAPETLREVGGIGEKRVQSIREAWREQKAIQAAMVFLQSHGASPLLAHRIWKRYAERTIDILHHDPYRLAQDIRGVGFKTADRIAQELGVPHDAPARAEAALLHVVGELTDDGHVWVPADDVLARAERDLDVPRAAAERALEQLRIHRRVESDPANPQLASDLAEGAPTQDSPSTALRAGRLKTQDSPLPSTALRAGPPALLAPASLAACERGIASSLAALLRTPAKPTPLDVPAALAWYESQASLRLAPLQREAIARGLSEKVLVITGGPGTGKTTLLRGILAVLRRKRVRTALAAPTGRAAKRMTEATGVAAQTIHRLLAFDPKTWSFTRRRDRTLEADVVVIDEASMLDVVLAHHLLAAVPREARLLLVGDVDQLPSVGPGHVLSDIIASGRVPVVRLTEVFRQAAKSSIVSAAHDIRRGAIPRSAPARGGDFYFLEEEPENVTARIVRLVADDIPRRLGLDPVTDIQVLCPMNRGRSGSQELNDALQARLNPGGTEAVSGWRRLRVGDRVMQIANDYDREVYNGDLGRIVAAGADSGEVTVEFDGRPVAYGARDLDELMLAYACSIHKAQGSEYPVVVVPLVPSHWQMLARNLLYTAVTRGKRLVLLVGSPRALGRAVRNDAPVLRCTKLVERLHEMIPDT